jgi:hypothetical protein
MIVMTAIQIMTPLIVDRSRVALRKASARTSVLYPVARIHVSVSLSHQIFTVM